MFLSRLKIASAFLLFSVSAYAQYDNKTLSLDFVADLKNEQYHEAYGMMDTVMTRKITEDVFKSSCSGIIKQLGVLQDYTFVNEEKSGTYQATNITCNFKNASLTCRLAFNANHKVVGFHFLPIETGPPYSPPTYDSAKLYTERQITITTGEYLLPGILTTPNGVKNPPVVIFVHGSGPNDKDESIGPNKTFRDLAVGLALKGIATIRYDKRTRIYGSRFAKVEHDATVKEESVDDALSAVDMVGNLGGLDSNRIYVLGHSLGSMLAPRIAKGSKKIKGIIMMAGNARLLEDVMIYQMGYLASLDTNDMKVKEEQKTEIIKKLELAKSPDLKSNTPDSLLPYGVAAPYWIDINHYNQVKTAQALTLPILLMQGERDYQVTMDDYNLWKEKLSGKKNVTFKLYPKLNHLFMEGEGKSTPKEYDKPNHVPFYVVSDIANWINKK